MAQSCGKRITNWLQTEQAKDLIEALSVVTGIPVTKLTIVIQGGRASKGLYSHQGTWIHPKLAPHLAMWCDPLFALMVSDWILEWQNQPQFTLSVSDDAMKIFEKYQDLVQQTPVQKEFQKLHSVGVARQRWRESNRPPSPKDYAEAKEELHVVHCGMGTKEAKRCALSMGYKGIQFGYSGVGASRIINPPGSDTYHTDLLYRECGLPVKYARRLALSQRNMHAESRAMQLESGTLQPEKPRGTKMSKQEVILLENAAKRKSRQKKIEKRKQKLLEEGKNE